MLLGWCRLAAATRAMHALTIRTPGLYCSYPSMTRLLTMNDPLLVVRARINERNSVPSSLEFIWAASRSEGEHIVARDVFASH